jgi:hypothetical protein
MFLEDIFSVSNSAYKVVTNLVSANQPKHVILDPLTTVIRLALLSFKPKGTKIGIVHHQIVYYYPTVFQGVARFVYGDKRADLHNLHQPIKKASEWYNHNTDSKLKYIFNVGHRGLVQLKDNYDNVNNNYDSSTYMSLCILDNILTGKQTEIYDSVTPEKAEQIQREQSEQLDNLIHSKLKKLWDDSDIEIVYNLLNKIDKSEDPSDQHMEVLEKFLQGKDNIVSKIIVRHTTSL